MAGIGGLLSGIGQGLGQFAQQRQQQMESNARLAALRQALQQQQQEQEGLGIIGGLKGLDGLGRGQGGLGGLGSQAAPQAQAAAPMAPTAAAAPPPSQFNGDPGTPGKVTGIMPLDSGDGDVGVERAVEQGVPVLDDNVDAGKGSTEAAPIPKVDPTEIAAAPTQERGGQFGVEVGDQFIPASELIPHHVSLDEILGKIRESRPDASPQAAGAAALKLYGLLNNRSANMEQVQALGLVKTLLTQQTSNRRIDATERGQNMTADARKTSAGIAQQNANTRQDLGGKRIEQGDRRIEQQGKTHDENLAQRKIEFLSRSQNTGVAATARQLMSQRRTIMDQTTMGIKTPEQQEALAKIDKQIEDLYARASAAPK